MYLVMPAAVVMTHQLRKEYVVDVFCMSTQSFFKKYAPDVVFASVTSSLLLV